MRPEHDTYNYFTDPKNLPREEDKGKPWYEARMAKIVELQKLERLDDGEMVFRDWAKQFKGRTMEAIADELRAPGEAVPLLPTWTAMESHQNWMKEHGETRDADGPFIAVMHYGATGEGETVQVIAAHADSLAHFMLHCGKEVDGYYFVIGMDFFRNLKEAKNDRVFNHVVPKTMHGFFHPQCNVDVNARYHVNCS